ncbi:hypothetical protein Pla52o_34200 [Novipirellula galeiformis]|uniref:Uncharacterized protein n=1 Tax=Novipirellula galeiformis TaxID=2528004 RepID=A0A5C6CFQ7_9BACT|nr:hypothetical protein Pla52o_34200 [Novipirellula galeiformis]
MIAADNRHPDASRKNSSAVVRNHRVDGEMGGRSKDSTASSAFRVEPVRRSTAIASKNVSICFTVGRVTEGFYVTAMNEASDHVKVKLYQRERMLPKSEGDREATSVKTMLSAREPALRPAKIKLAAIR